MSPTAPNAWRDCSGRPRPHRPTGSRPRRSRRSRRRAVPSAARRGPRRAVYYPDDGRGNAADAAMALAAGAHRRGMQIGETPSVTGVTRRDGPVAGVTEAETSRPSTWCPAGVSEREVGALASVGVPLQALARYYVVAEPIPGLPASLPTMRVRPGLRLRGGRGRRLIVGGFERAAGRGPPTASPPTRIHPPARGLGRPRAGLRGHDEGPAASAGRPGMGCMSCGAESFTPDGLCRLGEAPDCAAASSPPRFDSVGSCPGRGRGGLTDSMMDRRSRSTCPSQCRARLPRRPTGASSGRWSHETLDLGCPMPGPTSSLSVRGLRAARCATGGGGRGRLGELLGSERATRTPAGGRREFGLARPAELVEDRRPSTRQPARPPACSILLGELLVQGRATAAVLQRVGAGDVAAEPGRIVSTHDRLPRRHRGQRRRDPRLGGRILLFSGPATLARDRD